ncbi:MAG: hypothetical protein N2595_08450 [bacterium]|nr:hypothetical protein [bacterium]
MLHNLVECYKAECLPPEDQPPRVPTLALREFACAARVTRHVRTITPTLASYAHAAAETLRHRLSYILRNLTRITIPPVAPALAPVIYRRT